MPFRLFPWIYFFYVSVTVTNCLAQTPLPDLWKANEGDFNFPFVTEEYGELYLENYFVLDSLPQDSLFLYFEGVGWEASLELNDIFLGIHRDPFQPWVIPVAPIWCKPGKNKLRLHLKIGEMRPFYPRQFLGIFRPALLINRQEKQDLSQPIMKRATVADTVVALAPYYGKSAYIFDSLGAAWILSQLKNQQFKFVFFPFSPDRKLQAWCKELGLEEVRASPDSLQLVWMNAYPYEAYPLAYPLPFWIDQHHHRTSDYGISYGTTHDNQRGESPISFLLFLVILFPLLAIWIIKLLSPALFELVKTWRMKPKIWVSAISDLLSNSSGMLFMVHVLRIISAASLITLIMYYISLNNYWGQLNWFKDWSLLTQFFYGNYSLEVLFVRSLIVVLLLCGLDLLMGWAGSTLFRIPLFTSGIFQIRFLGSFPLLWGLAIPWAFALLAPGWVGILFSYVGIISLIVFVLREVYSSYLALEHFFNFSPAIKILYICALNILPYIIWF